MSKQEIIDRILADAQAQSEAIVAQASQKAAGILAAAEAYSKKETEVAQRECNEYARDVMDKKAAAARLEAGKVVLAEKRKVLDYIYSVALLKLKEHSNQEPLAFYGGLLERYAEQGDVVFFPEGFSQVDAVAALPVFATKELQVSSERAKIDGGVLLVGAKADKDVSLKALIEQDKERHLSEIAASIF
jgi:V/A-type H+-transporting ATPase subunit E